MNIKRIAWVLSALIAALFVAACTTEREAVDKTPVETLDKQLFEGEFFYRQTVTELPYSADFAFIGESNDGKILKWKITKNWLLAVSVHDKVEIVDTAEQVAVNETVVLAFPILQHFDILPVENPTTGEDLPVLQPNTDCKWNECRYFMIDQSVNAQSNFELKYLWLTEEWGAPYYRNGIGSATDLEFYSHDGSYVIPKDYQSVMKKEGDAAFNKEVEWFTFKTKEVLNPLNDWSSIYSWEDIEDFLNNEPMNITYKHTFIKVNRDVVGERTYDPANSQWTWKKGAKDNGFRPLEFQDQLFRRFGFFTNNFRGYDPVTGAKDKDYHVLANYFNIAWAKAGGTDGVATDWNFTCPANQRTAATYNTCLEQLKYQQKVVFTSSAETPLRMLPVNCAMAKDYNRAFLAARFAAMNPGSDTREFDKWYFANYTNDFFKTVTFGGKKITVRDEEWYLNPPANWEDKCFLPNENAVVQSWDGTFKADKSINEIVAFVKNPVMAYVAERDGRHLGNHENYENFYSENYENAVFVCVPNADADAAAGNAGKLVYFENCLTNEAQMTALYETEYQKEWKGDRYDCQVLAKDETCPAGYARVKAACEITEERTCKVYDNGKGLPKLRHRYVNGDLTVAMFNWVDQPTDYGILGVSQWNVNPETGQSFAAGSNIAGSVLEWVTSRGLELTRMLIDQEDPAAWDWQDLMDPEDYTKRPQMAFNNDPEPRLAYTDGGQAMRAKPVAIKFEDLIEKNKPQQRFDYSSIRGSKWEKEMVPYSIRTTLFPWTDSNYSDPMKEMMSPWYNPESLNADMIKYQEGMKMDFFMNEEFLDGAVVQFIKKKQAELKKEGITSSKPEYVQRLLAAMFDELELLLYKGVAQHEMGHSVGLRHNFIGSMDQANYRDGFFAPENYPAMMETVEAKYNELIDAGTPENMIGKQLYYERRNFEAKMNYYTYSSVMDYQREAYIHAMGLGKYDDAALKFVYGRAVEQYDFDADGFFKTDTTNPIRDPKYPYPILLNRSYIDETTGELKPNPDPKEMVTYFDTDLLEYVTRLVPATVKGAMGAPLQDSNGDYLKAGSDYLLNDASIHKYLFFSDEKQTDEPGNKIFDYGYTGVDSIRGMADQDEMYYFLRYFKRGNPKFREFRGRKSWKMILDTLLTKYKFVHYMLDLNYNFFQSGWFGYLPSPNADGTTTCNESTYPLGYKLSSKKAKGFDVNCVDYSMALEGKEWFVDTYTGKLRTIKPFSMGDYLLASYEGINHLVFDIIYRPDADWHAETPSTDVLNTTDKLEPGQTGVWNKDNYIRDHLEGDTAFANIQPNVGRYHRDHYDIQDDPTTYYEKVIWRGFSEEKMVAFFTISNQGWLSGKYQRESMANGLGQMAPGVDKLIVSLLSDVANENALITYSPYCIKAGTNEVVRAELPIDILTTMYGWAPMPYTGLPETPNMQKYGKIKNLCAIGAWNDPTTVYNPIHAGWIYFDKMWPLYWGIGNIMNTSADTSVMLKFATLKYSASETNMRPVGIDEVESISKDSLYYYRAKMPTDFMDAADILMVDDWRIHIKDGMTYAAALAQINTDHGHTFADVAAAQQYLRDKYMRFSPSYRLVFHHLALSEKARATGDWSADNADYFVAVMETTLDQMNSFITDHLGEASFYASHY